MPAVTVSCAGVRRGRQGVSGAGQRAARAHRRPDGRRPNRPQYRCSKRTSTIPPPQVLGFAMERLLEAGALDVTLEPVFMKKNRPAHAVRSLRRPKMAERWPRFCFAETSTLGMRIYTAERRVQARSFTKCRLLTDACASKHSEQWLVCSRIRRLPAASRSRRMSRFATVIAEANSSFLKGSIPKLPMSKGKYYLTTPIYYVNAAPHIGTRIRTFSRRSDQAASRSSRAIDPVVLTTGSDEHGQKVERAAKAAGKTPEEYATTIANEFVRQWQKLGICLSIISSAPPIRSISKGCARSVRALREERLHLQRVYTRANIAFTTSCT